MNFALQIFIQKNEEENYLTSVSLKKTFKVSINKQISVIPSRKKYEWNWLNDKRVINTEEVNENNIKTKPRII